MKDHERFHAEFKRTERFIHAWFVVIALTFVGVFSVAAWAVIRLVSWLTG